MAAADYYSQVQQAYIAYYGRPADPAGLIYWANQLNQAGGDLNQIINAFGNSTESNALYSSGNLYTELNQIYQTLFGRDADSAGANYYVEQIQTGKMTLASIALNVYNGAQGSDADALAAKLQFATAFTNDLLQSSTAAAAYGGDAAAGNARTALLGVTDSASAQTAINNLPTTIANIGAGAVTYLTTGADVVTGSNIVGSLTQFNTDGKGPTLNYNDVITGSTGGTNNTLTLNDDYASANDVIPLGASISNIQNVVLQTAGNAGGTASFDTSNISGVTNLTVKSAGTGPDNVKAAATTDINVSHLATSGSVLTAGGKNVTVNTAAGNVTVGSISTANVNPVGAVNVTAANNGNVTVFGGTTVTVNDAGQNSTIQIGTNGSAVSASEPTGAVTVNATGTGSTVDVYGGTDVTVTSAGGNSDTDGEVQIGAFDANNVVHAPTGNVTVTVNQAQAEQFNFATGDYTGNYGQVNILGGANVSVTTNAGSVYVGNYATNNGSLIAGQNPTGTVTVTDTAGAENVEVYGGTDVNVTAAGDSITIGNVSGSNVATPSGTVTVNNTASVAFNGINDINNFNEAVSVVGGTNVDVTTNAGSVTVGTAAGTAGSEATGTINVTDSSSGNVSVYGGTDVTVSAAGGTVIIGGDNAGASATGDVSVTQSAVETGGQFASRSAVNVVGGDNVTVNTTGGNVSVGSAAAPTTGAVVINDTFVGPNVDGFTVVGGTTVSINTTATSGSINVGNVTADIDSVTGALKNAGDYASGNVTIVNESKAGTSAAGASNLYGTGSVNVGTDGATSVSITGGTNAVITDIQTELSKGVSTLSNVSLDHVEGNVSINSDALTSLTVLNGSIGGAVYTVNNATAGHDLALTLGGDAVNASLFLFDTVADATAGAVTVADNGVASGAVLLDVTAAKSITVNTTAALTLGVDAGSDLTSVTLNNSAALNLSYSPGATNLASINASAATGAVTVAIDSTVTSFTGGAGNDVVTIDSNSLLHADETTYSTISGGAGNNTLVANYVAQTTDTALGSNAHITGFSTLALGDSAKSDSHTGSVYVAGVPAVTAVAQVSNLTFSQGHDYNVSNVVGESISVTITVGVTPHVISYDITGDTTVQNVAAGLAGAILAAGLTGFSVALQTGAIVITGPSDGTAFTISNTTLTNADPTDIDATATTPTPAVLGSAGTPADASYDASGFTALQVGQTAGDVAFTKVAAGTTLDVTASQGGASIVNYLLANSTGSKDALSLTVGVDGAAGSNGVTTTVATTGIETLNITSEGAAKSLNTVTIGDTGATSIVLNGDANIALTLKTDNLGASATGVTKVDASAATGAVNLSGVELSSNGSTVTGGAGLLTVAGGADAAHSDVITTGTGGGVITIGAGGSWVAGLTNAYGAGSETVDLTASASAVDTLVVGENTVATFNGSTGGVKGFEITSSAKTTDRLTVVSSSTTVNVVANAALQNASIAGLAYTISNGIVTFSGAGTHNISEFSATDLIAAAQAIASIAYSGTDTVLAFVAGGNTYVVSAEGNTLHDTSVTELVGVTGVAGFGTTAAGNTIVLTNTVATDTNLNDVATVGAKSLSYDETGYARSVLNTTSVGSATSVSLANLAASAVLEIGAVGAADLTNVAVSTAQLGTSGSDSLSLVFDAANTIGSLTVSGDNALAIQTSTTGSDVIKSFVDATNTVASITATGTGSLEIDSLTDTALKSFDASHVSGTLTLTASQAGLTILGATGGDTITANGAADTITVGSSTAAAVGAVSLTANGAADVISLNLSGSSHVIQAAGAGDTITIASDNTALVNLGGTYNSTSGTLTTALGHGDTVTLSGANTVTDNVWLGGSSTVNLGSANHSFDGQLNLSVTGDVTGATSTGNFALTTVNAVLADAAQVNVTFGNATNEYLASNTGNLADSLVNVSSATSLSQALDLAVKQALVLDQQSSGTHHTTVVNGVIELNANTGLITTFQYAGNTYVVEAVNNTNAAAAHSALGANDVVIELTGASASGATFSSGAVHATISAGQHFSV